MADSILKLRVESNEYDAKLKKAAEGIRHLADVAHQGGGELTGLEKSELDYVKALGEMETKSRTAAGSVRELESSYKELKVIYDQLNEVEKADEGGKALAASLEQIKQRAQEAKAQLESASQSLSDNGQRAQQSSGLLDALASKFTLNIDALKLFDMGLSAVNMALDVAKDAFFNNEEQLDEWGRVVESSQSLYEGFLNALNTGDISGFLSNIGRIEQAARDAYDALDALGTYNAFNQINIERTRTGMTESIADFRGGKGTKEGVKAAGDAYKKELADRQRLENEAYIAAVKEMAAKRGANAKDLMDALSGTYGHYQDLKNVQPSATRTRYIPGLPGQAGRYEEYKVAQNNQERLGEALRHLNDTELQSLQALGAQAQRTGTEIAQVDKQLTRVLNSKEPGAGGKTGGGGGRSGKVGSSKGFDISSIAFDANKAGLAAAMSEGDDTSDVWKALTDNMKESKDTIEELTDALVALNKAEGITASGSDNKPKNDDKEKESTANDIRSVAEGVGSMVSGLNQLGIELPAGLSELLGGFQAFTSILSGIASIVAVIAGIQVAKATPVIGWLLARGGTNRNGRIIHAATGYTVPGNFMSGDQVPAMLNSGETVLNKAQTAHLENELTNNQPRAMRVNGRISGHDIVLAADRSLAQEGKGHIVTWK